MESTQPLVSDRQLIKKESIAGGPVTCVSFLSETYCWVARGCFLELSSLERRNEKKETALVFPKGGTIHGIQHERNVSIVFGGRQLAILHGGQHVDDPIEIASILVTSTSEPSSTVLTISDWIWNVKMLVNTTDDSVVNGAMALANNACEVWSFQTRNSSCCYTATRLRKIVGATRSITYSMCFHGWNTIQSDLILASGTVSNEILVWTALDEEETKSLLQQSSEAVSYQCTRERKEQCLKGHLGVIHAVCFNETGDLLASASDDRSVRLWQKTNNCAWVLLWSGWSHSARVWNVAFSQQGIVSCSEDASTKVWCKDDGTLLGEVRVHNCQSLWSIDVSHNLALFGCNDGTAKLWDLSSSVVRRIDNNVEEGQKIENGATSITCHVPDDRDSAANSTAMVPPPIATDDNQIDTDKDSSSGIKTTPHQKKKAKVKVKSQTICGVELYQDAENRKRLLVATRAGSLFSLCLETHVWETCEPWWVLSLAVCATDGSCIAVHSKENVVAVGTTRGDVILVSLEIENDISNSKRRLCSARRYLSIKHLAWLDDTTLLSFHIKGIVLVWTFSDESKVLLGEHDAGPHLVLNTTTMAVPTCFSRSTFDDNSLLVGDSRGNIAIFPLDTSPTDGLEVSPMSLACRVHKKEYVNDIVCLPNGKIISVGNDGCLRHSIINALGELESILSIPLSALPGPTHIYLGNENVVFVAGYHGNSFLALDVLSGYEIFRVETGGRQRTHCCFVDAHQFPVSYGMAICVNRADGLNDIIIQSHFAPWHVLGDEVRLVNQSIEEYNLGVAMHGEPVFDLCLFTSHSRADYNVLLSGSEDCTARVSIVRHSEIVASQLLPTQSSCVRAVCSSRHSGSNTSLLVVSGGQMTVHFYTLLDENEESLKLDTVILDRMTFRFIGTGYYPFKPSVDPRINAVRSVPVAGGDDFNHIVVTGDSDGGIHFFQVSDQNTTQRSVKGQLLFSLGRPILSLEIVTLRSISSLFIIAGTTDGVVVMWVLPMVDHSLPLSPLDIYEAHQVGTNSISSFVTNDEEDRMCVRICSGGDDQSIAICTVDLSFAPSPKLSVVAFSRFDVASASAIKGVKLVDANHVLSVGYSQRLALWQLSHDSANLKLLSKTAVDVADVNCFSVSVGVSNLTAVGGMGIELLTLSQNLGLNHFLNKYEIKR